MGFLCFDDVRRQLVLTDEGADLAREVSSVFSRISAPVKKLRNAETIYRPSGTVRISVPTSFALRWLYPTTIAVPRAAREVADDAKRPG
jgi:LysR family glycine cleavage system transcriptional activator